MKIYTDGNEALLAWIDEGGAMNYDGTGKVPVWQVGTYQEIRETAIYPVRDATESALAAMGKTQKQIDRLLLDWQEIG